jgi:hypothetical protein
MSTRPAGSGASLKAETAAVCALTLICTDDDPHLSDTGYRLMADIVFDTSGYARLDG